MNDTFVVYLRSFKGKSKKSGKDYCSVTFAEVGEYTKIRDFFVDVTDDALTDKIADLMFGDIVELKTSVASAFSDNVKILDVQRKAPSPYFEAN